MYTYHSDFSRFDETTFAASETKFITSQDSTSVYVFPEILNLSMNTLYPGSITKKQVKGCAPSNNEVIYSESPATRLIKLSGRSRNCIYSSHTKRDFRTRAPLIHCSR